MLLKFELYELIYFLESLLVGLQDPSSLSIEDVRESLMTEIFTILHELENRGYFVEYKMYAAQRGQNEVPFDRNYAKESLQSIRKLMKESNNDYLP